MHRLINYFEYKFSQLHGFLWKLLLRLNGNESFSSGLLRVASGSRIKIFGPKSCIQLHSAYIRHGCSIVVENGTLEIGDRFFMNNGTSINVHQEVKIGNDCIFGEGVKIYDHNHVFSKADETFNQQGFSSGVIMIGSNVWLGSNVVVLKDTTIGDNVVVGANCVVKGNIPPNSIVTAGRELSIQPINFSA